MELNKHTDELCKLTISLYYLDELNKLFWFQWIAKYKLNKWYKNKIGDL